MEGHQLGIDMDKSSCTLPLVVRFKALTTGTALIVA